MDNGQPDPKRPRTHGPAPPTWNPQPPKSRDLPPPTTPSYHGSTYPRSNEHIQNPLDRRHSSHGEHQPYESDLRRPNSGPHLAYPPHPPSTQAVQQHSSYGPPPPRDVMIKRDPGEDPSATQYRSNSTGSGPEHNVTPTHLDGRPFLPQPFDMAQHSGSPLGPPAPPSFRSAPPYPAPQSPMHGNETYGQPGYTPAGLTPRDQYPSVSYPNNSAQKRKPQRASQACDSCRQLKAKCDEGRPTCSGCKEKGNPCVYRDPPPKQPDKFSTELIDFVRSSFTEFNNGLGVFKSEFKSEIKAEFSIRITELEKTVEALSKTASGHPVVPKSEPDEGNYERIFEEQTPQTDSGRPSAQPTAPPLASAPLIVDTQSEPLDASAYLPDSAQSFAAKYDPVQLDLVESVEEEEEGDPVNPGQSSIPVNHTTGAARLLLVPPISALCMGILESDKIKNEKYPMLQEERRGLLRLYGRGEGTERLYGYDKDPSQDHDGATPTPSDSSSDAPSPQGEEWGQLGGLTSAGDSIQRGLISPEGLPDFDPAVVRELADQYMKNMNILHPILFPKMLDRLLERFLNTIRETLPKHKQIAQVSTNHAPGQHHPAAGFVSTNASIAPTPRIPESPGTKRKRSLGMGDSYDPPASQTELKPGQPFRSIGTAIVLLVMALGEISRRRAKLPDFYSHEKEESSWSSPTVRNGHPPMSPSHSSPAMSTLSTLPSPMDSNDRTQARSRRTSLDGALPGKATAGTKVRNLDTVPGLTYFAFATDIIGNQAGGNSLQHVHANILASLYHGQLGRPLESHAYLHQACRSLLVILRPKLDRFKKLKAGMGNVKAGDNPLIFAFWTCLQLESDIVAELPVPHSGILTYEEDMPGPNLQAAHDVDGLEKLVIESYSAQLYLRKHLNMLHNMFYKPDNDSEYPSKFSSRKHFRTIHASLVALEHIQDFAPNMQWKDDDPPATEILQARLRAKYYGAKVITYRQFLLHIIEHSHALKDRDKLEKASAKIQGTNQYHVPEEYSETFKQEVEGIPRLERTTSSLDPRIKDYAIECVKALIKSTTAFHGMGDVGTDRLIVTNIWGTAHAQWGNLITLQAAYEDPILRPTVDFKLLKDIFDKTVAFIKLSGQPSSALATDLKILEYVGGNMGLCPQPRAPSGQASASFSSTTSAADRDVQMTGH